MDRTAPLTTVSTDVLDSEQLVQLVRIPYGVLNYPSPNGLENEGVGGDFLDSYAQTTPGATSRFSLLSPSGTTARFQVRAAQRRCHRLGVHQQVASLRQHEPESEYGSQLTTPWFCAVSFVNPHDITDFPFTYGLTKGSNANFSGGPSVLLGANYQPAPSNASTLVYYGNNCAGEVRTVLLTVIS